MAARREGSAPVHLPEMHFSLSAAAAEDRWPRLMEPLMKTIWSHSPGSLRCEHHIKMVLMIMMSMIWEDALVRSRLSPLPDPEQQQAIKMGNSRAIRSIEPTHSEESVDSLWKEPIHLKSRFSSIHSYRSFSSSIHCNIWALFNFNQNLTRYYFQR